MWTVLLPLRTLILVLVGAVGLQLLGIDVFGMVGDWLAGLVDWSWLDFGALV